MAQRVQVILEDDLAGGPADETVVFGLDGQEYEIDLSAKNAEQLRAALKPFTTKARKTAKARTGKASRAGGRSAGGVNPADVRAWAKSQGIQVKGRGRLSSELVERYRKATGA